METRATLTSLSLHLSAGTMTLYLSFCAQILSYQDEWREGETESLKREMETERNGDRGGQLRWAKCQEWIRERLHKASLVLLSGVQHAESGIHACFRCWLLT